MATQEENKALVLRFYAELDGHDFDGAMALLAPDCVAHLPGAPGPLDPAGFRQFGATFYAAFPDGHHTFDEVIAAGDRVVTRGTFSGVHRGELQGMPPTGKHVSMSLVHIDHVAGGKIIEHWGQADMVGFMQQLGALPTPASAASR